jgi:hypothetical protein
MAIVLAVAAGAMLLGSLMLAAIGGVFYFRLRTAQQHALLAREEAMVQAERARQLAEQRLREAEADRAHAEAGFLQQFDDRSPRAGSEKPRVQIDRGGQIFVNSDEIELGDLQEILGPAQAVIIEADNECLFEHVARVLIKCDEIGIDRIDVRTSPDAQQVPRVRVFK